MRQEEAHKARSGLRFTLKHQRLYYLRSRGCTYSVPVQIGKYAVMGRRKATLNFDPERRTLSVPAVLRPPLLMERAIILCSGVLPRFDISRSRLEYSDVRQEVAHLAAQLLCQRLT
jgi:hypothetical protein